MKTDGDTSVDGWNAVLVEVGSLSHYLDVVSWISASNNFNTYYNNTTGSTSGQGVPEHPPIYV